MAARERLHDSWVEFMEALTQERPTVLLVEDLHWAEDDLCDLLDALVRRCGRRCSCSRRRGPSCSTAVPRGGERAETRRNSCSRHFRRQGRDSSSTRCSESSHRRPCAELIVERAEGNPFFVEELVATLIDTGVLERMNGGWSFGELPSGLDVPDSVQAVLAARIDLLPPAEKAALQAAAVIGRVFWTGPVYELTGGVQPDFGLLEERDFVRRRQGSSLAGEREYVIKHALTREVAYASLPKAVRGHRHAAFADWLERRGEGRDEHAPLLAYHYAEAVRPEDLDLAWPGHDEEVERLRAQGDRLVAPSRRPGDRPLRDRRRACPCCTGRSSWSRIPGSRRSSGTRSATPTPSSSTGRRSGTAMEKAIELGGPPAELYTELALQSVRRRGMWIRRHDPELVDGWVERALELSPEGSPTHPRALAALALRKKDEETARALQAMAERLGDNELRSHALAALTEVAWRSGDLDQARAAVEERLELLAEISAPDDHHFALMQAIEINLAQGRLSAAANRSSLLTEMVEGLTAHHRLHGVYMRLRVETLAGRWAAVRPLTAEAERVVEANATTPCTGNAGALLLCAIANAQFGDTAEARRLKRHADAIGIEGETELDTLWLWLALVQHDLGEVRRLVDAFETRRVRAMGVRQGGGSARRARRPRRSRADRVRRPGVAEARDVHRAVRAQGARRRSQRPATARPGRGPLRCDGSRVARSRDAEAAVVAEGSASLLSGAPDERRGIWIHADRGDTNTATALAERAADTAYRTDQPIVRARTAGILMKLTMTARPRHRRRQRQPRRPSRSWPSAPDARAARSRGRAGASPFRASQPRADTGGVGADLRSAILRQRVSRVRDGLPIKRSLARQPVSASPSPPMRANPPAPG